MWHRNFQQRLESWTQLRAMCHSLPWPNTLEAINTWWFASPWISYSLHWDDRRLWPDPWQLLEENRLCSLARGLGIIYTIAMLDRADTPDARLIETDLDNLVLVQGEKYILNWALDSIVNISPGTIKNSRHQLTLVEAKQKIH